MIARRLRESWWLLSFPLLAFFTIPLLALLISTPIGELWSNFGKPEVYQAIRISITTSAMATGVTVVFGTPVAYLMARRHFRFKRVVDTLIDLPTVLPPAVAGVALLIAFGRKGIIGGFLDSLGIQLAFTQAAVVLAQTFVAGPLFVKSATIGFSGVEPELEQAASMDGATGWRVFREVTIPLAQKSLLSGAVMTWARALGEFGATIIFAGNFPGRTQTMPLAIYIGFELELNVALTLSVILIAFSFLTLILVKGIFQKEEPAN